MFEYDQEARDAATDPTATAASGEAPAQRPSETPHRIGDAENAAVAFLSALMVFVKQCRAYPADHPAIFASASPLLDALHKAHTEDDGLTVGVAKRGLFLGKNLLHPGNRGFQLFASLLYDHGIATMTFTTRVTINDVLKLARLLEIQPSRLWQMGGPDAVLRRNGVTSIEVTKVSSDPFLLVDQTSSVAVDEEALAGSMWESLIRSLATEGFIPGAGGETRDVTGTIRLLLEDAAGTQDFPRRFVAAQRRFVDSLPPELTVYSARSLEKIASFVRELSPRLRKLFLMNLFGVAHQRAEFAESLVTQLPTDAVLDALKAVESRSYVPPLVQRLLARLGASAPAPPPEAVASADAGGDRMRELFRRDHLERFVPEPYLDTLVSALSADALPLCFSEEIDILTQGRPGEAEASTASLILELLDGEPHPDMLDGMVRSLTAAAEYLLDAGDFGELLAIAREMESLPDHPSTRTAVRELEKFFATPGFTDHLFEAIATGEKEKRDGLAELIRKIGHLIVPAMLARLAAEESMSIRRYYVERIAELGPAARDEVIARLSDGRWFFVRNLIAILRKINDAESLEQIRLLSGHPHPRIREEVMRTFGNCGIAMGDDVLFRELSCGERNRVLKAVRLSSSSRSEKVFRKLIELLSGTPAGGYDLELKVNIVATLASIGNPRALPHLDAVLKSRNLLRPILHRRLKGEIIRSLPRYGTAGRTLQTENRWGIEGEEEAEMPGQPRRSHG